MAQRNVRQLMRHHCRKLRFVVRRFDYAAIDKYISAGQGKRIDGLVVHAMKFKWVLHATRRKFGRQAHPELCKVGVHFGSIAQRQLLRGVQRGLLAQLNVLLRGEHVPSGLELRALRCGVRQE